MLAVLLHGRLRQGRRRGRCLLSQQCLICHRGLRLRLWRFGLACSDFDGSGFGGSDFACSRLTASGFGGSGLACWGLACWDLPASEFGRLGLGLLWRELGLLGFCLLGPGVAKLKCVWLDWFRWGRRGFDASFALRGEFNRGWRGRWLYANRRGWRCQSGRFRLRRGRRGGNRWRR